MNVSTYLKASFCSVSLFLMASIAMADQVLSYFNDGDLSSAVFFNDWNTALTENGTFVSFGSPAQDNGSFINLQTLNLDGVNYVSITARLDSGNTATGFAVVLYTTLSDVASASFSTSSFNASTFTTVTAALTYSGSFDATNVIGWGISGGSPTAELNFRYSFDTLQALSAIPEPSTWGVLLGTMAVGAVGFRRRRRALAA